MKSKEHTDSERGGIGYLYTLSVPIAAGLATLEGVKVAGFNYTGWMWVSFLFAGILLVPIKMGLQPNLKIPFPIRIWLPWFGFVWLSLMVVEVPGLRNIQDALQMTMPLLVGIVASFSIRTDEQLRSLFKCFHYSLALLIAAVLAEQFGLLSEFNISIYTRALALTVVLVGCVFLAESRWNGLRSVLGWMACLAVTFLTGSRMATFALLLTLPGYPFYRKASGRILAILSFLCLAVAVFYSARFQERFFESGSGGLKQIISGNFRSFGRFEIWPIVWSKASSHIILGAGIGETYSLVPKYWEGSYFVHNDYLRIIYEQGVLGLLIFLGVLLFQIYRLWRLSGVGIGEQRQAFIAAFLGLVVFALVAFRDNIILYNLWFMNPLFAIMGAAYGVQVNQPSASTGFSSSRN